MDQSPAKPDVSSPDQSPERSLPEITVRAVLLGAALSVILGAANVYLGLKAGMTVAASIPAAVVSMGLLRIFRRPSILENNIVQTAASAGESLAAGVLFTLPALLILGVWKKFDYWSTTAIAALGGIIGVLFTVPLRRALVLGSELRFPEGVATAEVLRVGDLPAGGQAEAGKGASTGLWTLVAGSLAGGLYKLGEAGLRLFGDVAGVSVHAGRTVWSAALGLAPALVGVGYIVGFNIAVLVFLGGAANWFVAIPIVGWLQGTDVAADPYKIARGLWSAQTRYIGVGAMVVGGLWALVRMWGNLVAGLAAGLQAIRDRRRGRQDALPREQRDMPVTWLAGALVACVGPMFFIFRLILPEASPALVLFMCLAMLVAAFVFSAVASYMAGLVGSSNNPISGVTIATILSVALLLMAVGTSAAVGPGAAILIGAVVCCAAAIGGDNMQDLKTGLLVGATPWKQQIMQMVGVLAGAVVMAPVLTVLLEAYGIGTITVEGQTPLEAPQATLMASVARGVFHRELPWAMVGIGAAAAVAVIVLDLVLERRKSEFRTPVLAVAVGLYLPLYLGSALLVGGLIAWAGGRYWRGRIARQMDVRLRASLAEAQQDAQRRGLLLAAGLITGEALLGIALAVPIWLCEGRNPLDVGLQVIPYWPGLILLAAVAIWLFRAGTRKG